MSHALGPGPTEKSDESLASVVADAALEARLTWPIQTRPARRFWEWLVPEVSHCPGLINAILVTDEAIWLGSSIGNRIQVEPVEGEHDWESVPELLASLPRTKNPVVQVAFGHGATFAEWMRAADIVRSAGLDVAYASEEMLEVRFEE